MSTQEARNLIIKDDLINNANLLELTNGSETILHSHAGGGGGVSTWIDLTDTDPANYTGEAGNTVVVNAGEDGLEFGAAPGGAFTSKCSAYQSVAQSIPRNETTKIELKAEDYDTDGEFDSTTNYRFQPAANGYYHVSVGVCLSSLGNAVVMYPQIYKNGSQHCFTGFKNGAAATVGAAISCDMYLLTTDFVELFVRHDDFVSRNTVVTNRNTFMTVHRFA